MSISIMRSEVIKLYPWPKWKAKVSNMSDNQVLAIYRKFQSEKKV